MHFNTRDGTVDGGRWTMDGGRWTVQSECRGRLPGVFYPQITQISGLFWPQLVLARDVASALRDGGI